MLPRDILLHLSLIPGVGPQTIKRLMAVYGDQLQDLYTARSKELHERTGLPLSQSEKIIGGLAQSAVVDKERELCARYKITWVTLIDEHYPEALKHIYAPPPVLYYQGVMQHVFEKSLALVGSREADTYVSELLQQWIPELATHQYQIISGGALGADTMVHEKTLQAQGVTWSVIGSGLLVPYPQRNTALFHKIIQQGGALISPFSCMTQALPENFPARNRIIAGLARATIVLQAAQKSGALITAAFARDEGRNVGAVPGLATHPLSKGCHQLIKEGAALIAQIQDIYDLMGDQRAAAVAPAVVMKEEDPLVALCREPQDFEELLVKTGLSYERLQQELFDRQLSGVLTQDFLGRWQIAA